MKLFRNPMVEYAEELLQQARAASEEIEQETEYEPAERAKGRYRVIMAELLATTMIGLCGLRTVAFSFVGTLFGLLLSLLIAVLLHA